MGLSIRDMYTAMQLMLAPVYVNDFVFEGRVLRVTMQADAPFRRTGRAAALLSTAGTTAESNSFAFAGDSSIGRHGAAVVGAALHWMVAAPSQARFNGFPAVNIS